MINFQAALPHFGYSAWIISKHGDFRYALWIGGHKPAFDN